MMETNVLPIWADYNESFSSTGDTVIPIDLAYLNVSKLGSVSVNETDYQANWDSSKCQWQEKLLKNRC